MANPREVLLNAYLDLSREGANLRSMAYAKAILWVLCAETDPQSIQSLVKNIAQLTDSGSVPDASVEEAVKLLTLRKLIVSDGSTKNYNLSPAQRATMERQLAYSQKVNERILTSRFPAAINKAALKAWFDDANSSYFGTGAEKLIALHSKKQKPVLNVEDAVVPTIKKHGLQKYQTELLQGYGEFLMSTDREEEEKVFNLLRSVLSSKLIAANISPDLLSLDRYKDAEFILDTNVLFAMRTFKNEEIEKALASFGAAAKSLNIRLSVAEFTLEEYERVRQREKERFVSLVNTYSTPVFKGMSQKDDFTRAILKLGCETEDDIRRFFEQTLEPLKNIGDQPVSILRGKELRGTHFIEEADRQALDALKARTLKVETTAIHDLRLSKLAARRSASHKTFVLTVDGAMEAYALEKVSEKEEPQWLSFYALIQILALNGGGPDFNPSDLAPLVKIFVEFEEASNAEKYDERDLFLLLEKSDRVNEVPEVQLVSLLNKLHRTKHRRSSEEALRDVVLELERSLRQNAVEKDDILRQKEKEIADLNEGNAKLTRRLGTVESSLSGEKAKVVLIWFAVRVIIYLLIAVAIAWFIRDDISAAYMEGKNADLIAYLLLPLSVIIAIGSDLWKVTVPALNKAKTDV